MPSRNRICLFSNWSAISLWTNASFIKTKITKTKLIRRKRNIWKHYVFIVAVYSLIFSFSNGHFHAVAMPKWNVHRWMYNAKLNIQFQLHVFVWPLALHPYLQHSSSSEWNYNKRFVSNWTVAIDRTRLQLENRLRTADGVFHFSQRLSSFRMGF